MADKKISALTAASTPLAGTEVLPIVQSSATVKVSVANLTAGRSVASKNFEATDAETYLKLNSTNPSAKDWRIISGGGGSVTAGYLSIFNASNGNRVFSIAPSTTEQFVTDTSGNLTLNAGNLIQGTAAKGVNFTANTGAAGMTSQLLNWYEEGTFTPVVADADSGGNTATGTFTGRYTRTGRIVHITIDLTNINTTGMTAGNTLVIRGLPFTASGTFNQYPFAVTWANVGISLPTNGSVLGGTSSIYLIESGSNVSQTYAKVSAVSSGSGLICIQGTYQV